MNSEHSASLRQEFDSSFQREPRSLQAERREVLLIRVGAQSYGLRLEQVRGIFKDQYITPLPGSPVALLGITGIRGHLVSVYDLAAWIGKNSDRPRWLALIEAEPQVPLALAFEALEGQISIEEADFVAGGGNEHVEGFLHRDTAGPLPVLCLSALVKNSEGPGV